MTDGFVLAVVVIMSCLPYLGGLGLYSDDWAFLSTLHAAEDSFLDRLASILPGLSTRPVQALLLAALYSLFGLEPLGYHVVNSAILASITVLFYASLRQLGISRLVAVAAPLIFGLLPHYSTDRFWIAAFQANMSVFLYFVSLYSDLRFVACRTGRRWLWKGLAITGLVGSVLAYEVTGALLLLNVLILWWVANLHGRKSPARFMSTAIGVGANIVFLVLTIGYKFSTTVRAELGGGYRYRVLRIFRDAVPVHFVEYGLALPWKVFRIVSDRPDMLILAISVLVGVVVFAYVLSRVSQDDPLRGDGMPWPLVILTGCVLFLAGYGISLMTWEIGFHATGANNRTAIGAAIGVSWVFVGVIGWACNRLPAGRARRITFSGLLALLAASCTLVTNTVATYWVSAAGEQQRVISSIQQHFPELQPGSTVLIDGLCPYKGPAPVFATGWDVNGMLRLSYGDRSLRGDVVKPNTEVTVDGIRTILFDDVINVYPYGDQLWVYHMQIGQVYPIADIGAARVYINDISPPVRVACPPYTDGDGISVF